MLALLRLNSGRARLSMQAVDPALFKEVEGFRDIAWPDEFPFKDRKFFARMDESPDILFYNEPRFVTHIDDGAITSLTSYYSHTMRPGADVLDLCSSWISHLPNDLDLGRVAGLGMNEAELSRNKRLTERVVQDLNVNPSLPYEDESFDFVCNVVSVDYLTKPMEVFDEMHRVLRPGGTALMSFSNRCFPTKAIAMWTGSDDASHIWIVGSYFKFSAQSKGGWTDVKAMDISAAGGGRGDPMWVVQGTKASK
ncbi:hypothetical protein AB1Y20_001874 [Prymnesium parvum]|uniref:Methyltransferase type 11 domain-containing protein n=1 Tax=Prymnesium parvum TaxID=97485 RepID=A0AB34J8Y9_PRYPA